MQQKPRTSIARFSSILLVNLLLLVLGILVVELTFGNWRGTNSIMRLNMPQNVDIHCEYPPKAGGACHYKRDMFGLRGPFKNLETIDLLTVGGSTTDQFEISEGETWQDVIAQSFRENGKEVEIANAGIAGHSVYAHCRSFRLWLRHIPGLKPKYILAYVGINDYCADPHFYYDFLADEPTWKTLFKKRSAVYYLYRTLRGVLFSLRNPYHYMQAHDPEPETTDTPLVKNHEEWMKPRLAAYETRLSRLVRRIREFDAIPILVTQKMHAGWIENGKMVGVNEPYRCLDREVNGIDDYYMLNLVNKTTLKVCEEQNLICFDLAGELDLGKDDFVGDMHNTPQGSAKIGHYLYGKLKPLF